MAGVTIPNKHYVGMAVRTGSKMPLGFITPYGEDAAAAKRIDTVDRWRNKDIPATVIDNVPMLGFRLSGGLRRGMQGGQDKWRIEDPRGFELEITSDNLSMLLADTTLEKGEILDQCVWAREGGQNLLLTTVSEEYIEAVKLTEISAASASWKNVKPGYTVILQNGLTGRYLGKMHMLQEKYRDNKYREDNMIEAANKAMYLVLCDVTEGQELHLIGNPKLSSFIEGPVLTWTEAEIEANDKLRDPDCEVRSIGYRDTLLFSSSPIKKGDWRLRLDDMDDGLDPWKREYKGKIRLARMKDGTLGLPFVDLDKNHIINIVREDAMADGIYDTLMKEAPRISRTSWLGRGSSSTETYYQCVDRKVDPADVASFHHLRVEITSKYGTVLWNHV